jgi:glutathione S-transferase
VSVKLHRCRFLGLKRAHACWRVQSALDEQEIEYEIVKAPTFPRGRRKEVIEHTGQHYLPAVEFEDGTWYRESSEVMAAEIAAGRLFEKSRTASS